MQLSLECKMDYGCNSCIAFELQIEIQAFESKEIVLFFRRRREYNKCKRYGI